MKRSDEQFESIACQVCNKPSGLTAANCRKTHGNRSLLCSQSERCRVDEKTRLQCDYVLCSGKKNVFLRACPGSGKTEAVGLKAAYEISQWRSMNSGIAILTFTNNAADVIRERVLQFMMSDRVSYPHYVGTIDSWLHGYLANPFGHIVTRYTGKNNDQSCHIVEAASDAGFLCNFRTKYAIPGHGNIPANQYYLSVPSMSIVFASANRNRDQQRNAITLETWQKNDLIDAKRRFWLKGFATYQDMESICYGLLTTNTQLTKLVASRFPLIIVDECQDLSEAQLQILQRLLDAGSTIHLIGDLNQAIYAFKRVDPSKVADFASSNHFEELELIHNFRSYNQIIELCSKILPQKTVAINNYTGSEPICVWFPYEKTDQASVVEHFTEYIRTRGIAVDKSAILARGRSTVSRLRPGSSGDDVAGIGKAALAIHLWQAKRSDSMAEALQCMGNFIATKLLNEPQRGRTTFYCPWSVESPLRWRLLVADVLEACSSDEDIKDLSSKWADWASAFRAKFGKFVANSWEAFVGTKLVDTKLNVNAPAKQGAKPVFSSLGTTAQNANAQIRITTIHKAKGETLDAALIVSSRTSANHKGGHWREWLQPDADDGEHSRFAFVGSSRPRFLLAWAIPSPSEEDIQAVEDLGFTPAL